MMIIPGTGTVRAFIEPANDLSPSDITSVEWFSTDIIAWEIESSLSLSRPICVSPIRWFFAVADSGYAWRDGGGRRYQDFKALHDHLLKTVRAARLDALVAESRAKEKVGSGLKNE